MVIGSGVLTLRRYGEETELGYEIAYQKLNLICGKGDIPFTKGKEEAELASALNDFLTPGKIPAIQGFMVHPMDIQLNFLYHNPFFLKDEWDEVLQAMDSILINGEIRFSEHDVNGQKLFRYRITEDRDVPVCDIAFYSMDENEAWTYYDQTRERVEEETKER